MRPHSRFTSHRLAPLAVALLTFASLGAGLACTDATAPAVPQPTVDGGTFTLGTLEVRATSALVARPGIDAPPPLVQTTVTLTNRGAWPLELRTLPCPLHVAAHRTAARTGAPAFVYPSARAPWTERAPCAEHPRPITLAPGASQEVTAAIVSDGLLIAGLRGRFFLTAELRLEGAAPLLLSAGDVTL